jgi:hypothetical protein
VARSTAERRRRILAKVEDLAEIAVFGTLAETYRTCGTKGCRCHHGGPKHGPHLYVTYHGERGKTTGYYVPKAAQKAIRRGVDAWHELQSLLKNLAELNKKRALAEAREERP